MLTLLTLPPELIGQILFFLSPEDIITCSRVNTQLRTLMNSSVLQYRLALDAVRADDNPLCIDSIASKLQALKNSENAWKFLDSKQRRKVKVTYLQSGVYDLSAGIYLLSNQGRRRLYTIDLNSLTPNTPQAGRNSVEEQQTGVSGAQGGGDEEGGTGMHKRKTKEEIIKWKKVESDKFIVDLGLCVYEHDLIALVTTAPQQRTAGEPGLYEIAIDIRQLSTDTPHPRAKSPTLFVMNSRYERPAIGIEIVGKHLVLILTFNHQDRPQDRVFIFQWMDGVLKASFEARHRSYSGLLFLDTELICLPNTHANALDIFRIPEAPTLESPKPIVRLGLPKLTDGRVLGVMSCRAEPNPVHPDSFAEMRAHSTYMRNQASTASLDARFAPPATSNADPAAAMPADEPKFTHDASKVALGQAFQRVTVAASEHALCLFDLHILAVQLVLVPGGAVNMQFQFRHRLSFVSPRSALLAAVAAHEARLLEQDRAKAEKAREATLARAERERERTERERDTEERKRKRAMEAGPSRARANSPSVEEFVRQRERDAHAGDSTGKAGSLFGRTDWPPADVEMDDDHDERPYVPFGEGQRDPDVAVSSVTATRTDVAGPSGESSTVVATGNVQPDSVENGTTPGHLPPYVFISGVQSHNTHNADEDASDMDAEMPGLQDISDSDDDDEEDDGDGDDEGFNIGGFAFNGLPGRTVRPDRTLVPWREWSVDRTRWFNSDGHINHWITTSAGERLVRMADHINGGAEEVPTDSEEEYHSDGGAPHGSAAEAQEVGGGDGDCDDQSDSDSDGPARRRRGAPFSVLDFNPRRVAAMRRWVEQQEKHVVRGLKRPATREEQADGDHEEDTEGKERRDRAFVASDGEAPTLGKRADGWRRRQRNGRTAGSGDDKGKGKAKQTEDDWALEQRRKREREHHVVGVWKAHPSKRERKGKGKEKPEAPPVPEYIMASVEEVLVTEPESEPVLSTGYAVVTDDGPPEQAAQNDTLPDSNLTDAEAAEFLDLAANPVPGASTDGPETNVDAAGRAMDDYLAQFDDEDDEDYSADKEAEDEDEMDVEGDFMDFIEQDGDGQDDDDESASYGPYLFQSEDSDDLEDTDAPHEGASLQRSRFYIPFKGGKRPEAKRQFLSTGGHVPAKLVLARPPPDSLWVVPGGDLFESEQIFAEPIINGLPYVLCTSRHRYTYDGIMLDEDRVIGTKANEETGRIESIDLHYFA